MILVAAKRERGRVHHLEILDDGLVERQRRIAARGLVLQRIGRIDAVHFRRLQHDVDAHLAPAQRRGRVGREKRVAGARGEDDDPVLLEVAQRAAADVRLGDLVDPQRRLHSRFDAGATQRVLQRERIHKRGQHAHVVGGCTIHSGRAGRDAAEDVAAADDDGDLDAEPDDLAHFGDDPVDRLALDAVTVAAHQRFA